MVITKQTIRDEVSQGLRLRVRGTVASYVAGPPTTLVVQAVGDLMPQSASPISSYAIKKGVPGDFPRVIDYTASTATLTLSRDPAWANGDTVDIYSILTPTDWDEAIELARARLYRLVRIQVNLVDGQQEYTLAGLAPWLIAREQIEEVRIRKTDGSADDFLLYEEAYPAWELELDDNVAKLRLHALPSDTADVVVIIVARRFYEKMATDQDTFTGSDFLIKSATKVEALRTIWALMGEKDAKDMFANEFAEALNDLADAKRHFLPQVSPRAIQVATPFTGPELAVRPNQWRW